MTPKKPRPTGKKITAKDLGANVNAYGSGDINILVKPLSYIDSITNLNGISGGADIETDEAYIKRILLAPEKFSCAGSRQSYIYHALSANTKILDATAESVIQNASIKINASGSDEITTYSESDGQIVTPDFTATVKYKLGQFNFTLNNKDYSFNMPPDTTVNIYPLTDDDTTSQDVLNDVEALLNGDDKNPMTDNVVAISPTKVQKSITVNVHLEENANEDFVQEKVNSVLNEYKTNMRKKLGTEIVPSQIITQIGAIDGVYSIETNLESTFSAEPNEYFDITFTVTFD